MIWTTVARLFALLATGVTLTVAPAPAPGQVVGAAEEAPRDEILAQQVEDLLAGTERRLLARDFAVVMSTIDLYALCFHKPRLLENSRVHETAERLLRSGMCRGRAQSHPELLARMAEAYEWANDYESAMGAWWSAAHAGDSVARVRVLDLTANDPRWAKVVALAAAKGKFGAVEPALLAHVLETALSARSDYSPVGEKQWNELWALCVSRPLNQHCSSPSAKKLRPAVQLATPDGHLKFLHLWPGQTPPPGRRRDEATLLG